MRELHVAPLEARLGVGEHRAALRARERHIEQTPFLLEPFGRFGRALRRKKVLLQSDDVDVFELQPLGRVDGHQRHLVVVARILLLVHVGSERHALQPLIDGRLCKLLAAANLGVALLLEELHRVEQLLDIDQR